MSPIEYFDDYQTEIYPIVSDFDPKELEKSTNHPLKDRIEIERDESPFSIITVDQCIRARVASEQFRTTMAKQWQENKNSHQTRGWASVLVTPLIAGAAYAAAFPWIGAASVISIVYSGYSFYRSHQASSQIQGWQQSPAEIIANKRREAYEKGFPFVYRNDLKLKGTSKQALLLPVEVEHLFQQYAQNKLQELSFAQCLTNQDKKQWFDRFRTVNPVSPNILQYAYGNIPSKYERISKNYESVAASLSSIEKEFGQLRTQRRAETSELLDQIQSRRRGALSLINLTLHAKLRQAEATRQNKLQQEGHNRFQIDQEYDSSTATYHAVHAGAVLAANTYFDSKEKEAKQNLETVLKTIHEQEAEALRPYYEYCQAIVTASLKLIQPQSRYVYQQEAFNPDYLKDIPQLPNIQIDTFRPEPKDEAARDFWNVETSNLEPSAPPLPELEAEPGRPEPSAPPLSELEGAAPVRPEPSAPPLG